MVVGGLQSQHNHYHFCDRSESGVFLHLGLCALPRIDIMTYQHKSKAQPAKSKEPGLRTAPHRSEHAGPVLKWRLWLMSKEF